MSEEDKNILRIKFILYGSLVKTGLTCNDSDLLITEIFNRLKEVTQ